MVRYCITIDGYEFHLAEKQDVDVLEAEILTAAERGAGFVDLSRDRDGSVKVLVNASTSVKLQALDDADYPTDDDQGQHYDPDFYQL